MEANALIKINALIKKFLLNIPNKTDAGLHRTDTSKTRKPNQIQKDNQSLDICKKNNKIV